MERNQETPNSNTTQQKQQLGLTNTQAISIIIDGLQDLLTQREQNFRDHTQRCKKKVIIALQRIFHPFTLLTLAYCAGMIYNITQLQAKKNQQDDEQLDYIEKDVQITQHIITIVVVLLLVITDIYLKIQRLNFRVFNIDSKIQKLIEQFQPNNQQVHDDDWRHIFISQSQEKEFSYYQNCFTWTLRGDKWRKIPNNTLAKGDIIKLLPGDIAPAFVKLYYEDQNTLNNKKGGSTLGLGIAKSPPIGNQDPNMYFIKRAKIVMAGIDEILQKVSQMSGPIIDKSEPAEAFEKQIKEYKIFEVQNTPCIEDLTEYINNMESKKEFSKNLLYFSNVQLTEKILDIFQAVSWIVCIAINIAFISTYNSLDYVDNNVYLPLIGYSFMVPQIFSICEAWANALIITLFNSLQFEDYNKKLTGTTNFYKLLKKQNTLNSNKDANNASIVLDKPLLQKKKKKKRKALDLYQLFCCLCDRSSKQHQRSKKHKEKRRAQKNEKLQQMMTGFVRTDSFYKNYDFQNRGIKKNWKQFWKYVRSGSNHLNNVFAALSSVSVLAFVDKEGIISETSKYVDEVGVIDNNEQKIVFDLIHDSHVKNEEDVYSFENPLTYKENVNLLKALGLSMMLSRNPKETDNDNQLKEIFTKDAQLSQKIKNEVGFHFQNAMRNEAESHQDCVCALSKLIGHTDASFHNFEILGSIWNIKKTNILQKKEKKNNEMKKVIDLDQKKHRSYDDQSISQLGGSQPDMKSISDDVSLDIKSFRSEQSVKGKAIFADQKNLKKMLMEKSQKFSNIVTTIVKDKQNLKYQSFSRGEANIIFNSCSDYWNGEKIVPINKKVKRHIKDILFQWQASDFVTIGFSYKPLIPELQALVEKKSTEKPQKIRELLENFQKNQIFLGIIGVKHHKKQEANKLFESLDDAGIRGVLFSKEGVLETKSLAKELGIDSEWNAWISLAENPSDFTKLYNEDGHLILPYGIEGIKKHIEEVDKIPLQVPMFCDSTAETTQQMFQIYQQHGDVVCCIGNIINSENLHIFQQANVAVGMMIEPQYRCYRCNGRISHNQQRSRFSQFNNMNKPEYMPTKLEKLSAAINALACTFVFDANTNIYFFFSVFREARRLRESVEQASLLALFLYLNVFLLLFIDLCLGIYDYIDQLETLYILFVFVPLFSFSCMSRPTKNSIMKRHVLSPKYLPYLDFAIWIIKSSFLKILICTGLMYGVRIYYIREAINQFRHDFPQQYIQAFDIQPGDEDLIANQYKHVLYGNYYQLKKNYQYWNLTFEQEHKFNFSFLLIMLLYLTIGFESPNQTLLFKFTKNQMFRILLGLQFLFTIAYYLISTMVFFGPDAPYHVHEDYRYYYPDYKIWLTALGSLFIIAIVEELTKRKVRKLFDRDHNRLMIFFSTKLGMWSPR